MNVIKQHSSTPNKQNKQQKKSKKKNPKNIKKKKRERRRKREKNLKKNEKKNSEKKVDKIMKWNDESKHTVARNAISVSLSAPLVSISLFFLPRILMNLIEDRAA